MWAALIQLPGRGVLLEDLRALVNTQNISLLKTWGDEDGGARVKSFYLISAVSACSEWYFSFSSALEVWDAGDGSGSEQKWFLLFWLLQSFSGSPGAQKGLWPLCQHQKGICVKNAWKSKLVHELMCKIWIRIQNGEETPWNSLSWKTLQCRFSSEGALPTVLPLNQQGEDGIVEIGRIPRAEGLEILGEFGFGAQHLPWALREHWILQLDTELQWQREFELDLIV